MSKPVPLYGFGGGVSLNFDVKSYTTEDALNAAAPKENTIGVITTKNITNWVFSPTEPETKEDGLLWISTGTSGDIKIDALKKNSLVIYPVTAKLCEDGNFVQKNAKIYQNSKWGNLWNGQLYDAGNMYTDVTGGWAKIENDITINFNETNIDFSDVTGTVNRAAMFTVNKIDVTNYNSLKIEGSDLVSLQIGVTNEKDNSSPSFVVSSTSNTVDLSGVSGSYYVCVAATYITAAKLTKIYLS